MTVEELKVRLCEEIKFNNDGYNNMCEVLEEFSEAQKTAHNSDYAVTPLASPKFPEYNYVADMFPNVDTVLLSTIYHAIKYSGNFA